MLIFNVNGEKVSCPVNWEEATTRVYQRLASDLKEGDNAVKVFSILTGKNYTQLWEASDETLEAAIYQATAFVVNSPQEFKKKPRAKTFRFKDGRTVTIPEKIHRMTVGQNFQIRQEMRKAAKEGKPVESLISIALAIYLQPLLDAAPFDFDRAVELEAEIAEMSIFDTYPAGFFLLNRLLNSGPALMPLSLSSKIRWWRLWPRLPKLKSWSLTVICISLIAMPGLTAPSRVLSSKSPLMSSCPCFWHGKSVTSTTSDLRPKRSY